MWLLRVYHAPSIWAVSAHAKDTCMGFYDVSFTCWLYVEWHYVWERKRNPQGQSPVGEGCEGPNEKRNFLEKRTTRIRQIGGYQQCASGAEKASLLPFALRGGKSTRKKIHLISKSSSEQVFLNHFCWVPGSRHRKAEQSSHELLGKIIA